jgi:hypothetical protein
MFAPSEIQASRLDPDLDDDNNELEEGNWILYTLFAPAKEIRARSTVSQHLAKAFAQNSAPPQTLVPPWVKDFSDIFDKEPFDYLPEHWT